MSDLSKHSIVTQFDTYESYYVLHTKKAMESKNSVGDPEMEPSDRGTVTLLHSGHWWLFSAYHPSIYPCHMLNMYRTGMINLMNCYIIINWLTDDLKLIKQSKFMLRLRGTITFPLRCIFLAMAGFGELRDT